MKITLFTSNNSRHLYLTNLLSNFCDELFVIQECKKIDKNLISNQQNTADIFKKYFENVYKAEKKLFDNDKFKKNENKIKILSINYGELNSCSMESLSEFLKSKYYIVFGSSYIKGDLVNFLVENKAINIHAGVSPYYKGTDCNFWALYDGNPHLVGATIHFLSKGLDSGPILYHAMSKIKSNPFEYTMSTVKSAFHSIVNKLQDNSILGIEPAKQDKSKLIRYSKKIEFNEKIINNYFKKNIDLNIKQFEKSLLKDPFFFNN
tara:strand:- start:2870 stop:3658 length:789 start_codon:yes stop_codon:yes gene_type:complete